MPLPLLSTLFAAALGLFPHTPPEPPAPAPLQDARANAARLLPADAVLVLRLDSVDGLLGLVNRFAAAAGEEGMRAEKLLAGFDLPGDVSQVDAGRPLWMVVSVSAQMPAPMMTFVVPATDLEAYARSVEAAGGWTSAVSGGYVGVSQTMGYALAEEPSALAGVLQPGLMSMHLDLETLIGAFRPFIEMGLDQAETQMDAVAQMTEGPMDIGPVLELYIDMAWDFVDSAEALDVALVQRGSSLELAGHLATLEGSPMASWGAGAPVDLTSWPAQVDPGASLSMAMGGDWGAMMKRMQPLLDASFAMYPEDMNAFFQEYMEASEPLLPLMGPVFVGGDLGPGGMRMGYSVQSQEPAELLESMDSLMQRFAGGEVGMGISVSAPETVEVGGVKARRFVLEIDYDQMAAAMGEQLGEAERAQFRDAMAAIYGEGGLRFTAAAMDRALVMALGGDEAYAERIFKTPAGAAANMPADFRRALAAASGGSMALVYRFDFGQMIEQFGELMSTMGGGQADFEGLPTDPLPMTFWGSIRDRTWTSGASFDLDALTAFIAAMAEASGGGGEEPFVFEVYDEPADSRTALVRAELALIEAGLELFALNNGGRYPDSLELLVMPDENGESYLDELPRDPWGNAYHYEPPTAASPYRLICYGADGAPGGTGDAADIVSGAGR